jgi:hypothetical protein
MGGVEIHEGKDGEINEMTKRILREKTKIPKGKTSSDCVLFLKALIAPRAKRITAAQCLTHDWLKSLEIEKIRQGEVDAPIKPRLDQANIDKNMGLVEFMMDEEAKVQKKVTLTAEQQSQFAEWDWLCDELHAEAEAKKLVDAQSDPKDKKGKKKKKSTSKLTKSTSGSNSNPNHPIQGSD